MPIVPPYSRDVEIRTRLNRFLIDVLKLPEGDYASNMDIFALLCLKSVLSNINNAITLRLQIGLGDWIADNYKLDLAARDQIRKIILESKPNSNGYDLWLGYPMTFIAEVKCNIPVNGGNKYGAQQKIGILGDVEALLSGKRKSPMIVDGVLKFMAFLDLPAIRAANDHLLKTTPSLAQKIRFWNGEGAPNDTTFVHGIYIGIEASHPFNRTLHSSTPPGPQN